MKLFSRRSEDLVLFDFEDIETNGLRQRPALSSSDDISLLDALKARRDVNRNVFVSFFKTVVLCDVVEVISSNDDGPFHFVRNDHSLDDATSNRHVAGERTLLVDVVALLGLLRRGKAEPDVLPIAKILLRLSKQPLPPEENPFLFLEGLLMLNVPLRRHGAKGGDVLIVAAPSALVCSEVLVL